MGITHHLPVHYRPDRIQNLSLRRAETLDLGPVGHQPQARSGHAVAVVDIDDIGHRLEDSLQLLGDRPAGCCVRAIDLGQQGREHRWSRRGLHHLQ